jgi:hypothetical protein
VGSVNEQLHNKRISQDVFIPLLATGYSGCVLNMNFLDPTPIH